MASTSDRRISVDAAKAALTGWETEPTDEDIVRTLDALAADESAVWQYYTNEENRPRWRCSKCGKIIKQGQHEKRYCSNCGVYIRPEA